MLLWLMIVEIIKEEGEGSYPRNRERQGIGWFTAEEMAGLKLAPGNKAALGSIVALMGRRRAS